MSRYKKTMSSDDLGKFDKLFKQQVELTKQLRISSALTSKFNIDTDSVINVKRIKPAGILPYEYERHIREIRVDSTLIATISEKDYQEILKNF